MADNQARSYSIANTCDQNQLEFHIRAVPGGQFSALVFEHHKPGDILRIYGPMGSFFLREDIDSPIIMIAGGTGFAPLKAMLETLNKNHSTRDVKLYWGVRTTDDIYLKFMLEQFSQNHKWFEFQVILSQADDLWGGRSGYVHQAVLDDFKDLSEYQVYASGPPVMINAINAEFFDRGLKYNNLFFDSFDYSPDTLAKINQTLK